MKILRTPDEKFENLPNFQFKPNYLDVDDVRIHYLDEGPKDGQVIILMHGEPTWCFLYRHMIPLLVKAGFRTLAPDLIGFGRSDKPTEQSDHTYRKHVRWITNWAIKLELKGITLFCQDWGSLIGLRVAIENQERFSRIILSNGGLPTGSRTPSEAFMKWLEFSKNTPDLQVGRLVQSGTMNKLSRDVIKGYDAPFPDKSYKAAVHIFPSLVPISIDDPEHKANKNALEQYKLWKKPFLTAFSDGDPITRGGDKFWQENVPGASDQNHVVVKGGGHFVQEDNGPELAEIIINFINKNPEVRQ